MIVEVWVVIAVAEEGCAVDTEDGVSCTVDNEDESVCAVDAEDESVCAVDAEDVSDEAEESEEVSEGEGVLTAASGVLPRLRMLVT